MTTITNRLLAAYRVTIPARAALAEVAWPEIPSLLRALGCEQSPENAAVIAAGIGDGSTRALVALRGILALAGDRARHSGGREHCRAGAAEEMCCELVNLLGAALSLLDVASRVAAGLD
jgi:hypothetical protein